jgi:hypothetical protein
LKKLWAVWFGMWTQINRYSTAWVAYAVIALGGILTYWANLQEYIPAKWRGATYAGIGIAVLIARARRDIAAAAVALRAPGAPQ